MQTFQLSILAPERKLLQNEPVTSVTLMTAQGEVQILPGHSDLVATLEAGQFLVNAASGKTLKGVISSGFINVENGAVKVLAETIELSHEIDLRRAKTAQEKAEKMLTDASLDVHAFKKYQLKLQRSIVRQSIGGTNAN